ncbi:MAG: 2-phospho-L-lactate transferase, partial [Solirubrobacteraceae bacterium]|nr:2-phospho-L-lactate transferase [Solirubrobacteraceae bacterium]
LDEGARLTETLAELATALGVSARVLPMCDEPVRTWVRAHARWMPFQEFMIRQRGKGQVQQTVLRGVGKAVPPAEVRDALADARAIIIGPSNPVISIGPILAVPDMRQALLDSPAPIVAVSPIVAGQVLKGPTEAFLRWAGYRATTDAIATIYAGLIDGLVADEETGGMPVLRTDTLMSDAQGRRRVAAETLQFAEGLA